MDCDTACIRIAKPVAEVFAFMADPAQLSLWSFGTWSVEIDATGLIMGRSIKDGATAYVRIEAHEDQRLIDYHIGATPDRLTPRIFARVTSGAVTGGADTDSLLTMTAFRGDDMDDVRWSTLKATHLVELSLIKAALETGYDHRNP